jgi:c-di-GMP-related signal transduction protein
VSRQRDSIWFVERYNVPRDVCRCIEVDVFVARQPIFDARDHLYGYELLFRSDFERNEFDGSDAASATLQVIANSLLSIGFENVTDGKKAFVNFDRSLLMGGLLSFLPRESVVVEILETVEPDAELVAVCKHLHAEGYTIALDDFVRDPRLEPLIQIAKLIKVDIQATTKKEQEYLLKTYRPRGISMLAEKVETSEEFTWAKRAGYDYFQGYFFTRPVVVRGRQVAACKATCLDLLIAVQQPELDFKHLAALIGRDVSLCHKLLQYVNSPLFFRAVEVRSIEQCLALVGEDNIRHWVALAALPILATNKPNEVVTHSLVRARFCERLAQLAGIQEFKLGFLMGLFSLLDALIDLPLEEALQRVNLPPSVRRALLGSVGPGDAFSKVFGLALRYEVGDWRAVAPLAGELKIKTSLIVEAYAESTLWAHQALSSRV